MMGEREREGRGKEGREGRKGEGGGDTYFHAFYTVVYIILGEGIV